MNNILTISKWEINRLRVGFSGRSRFIILAVILLAIISSYVVYHQGLAISKNLYTVGVSLDVPTISDKRFNVISLDQATGHAMLQKSTIDIYVDKNRIMSRDDQHSQHAAAALKKYLEKQELARIASEYDIGQAFPLRIEVRHLEMLQSGRPAKKEASSPLLESAEPAIAPTVVSKSPGQPAAALSSAPETEGVKQPAGRGSSKPARVPGEDISEQRSPSGGSPTDAAVRQQLDRLQGNGLPEFKAEFVSESDIIIPSLMKPPLPLAQVILVFLYIVPIFFVSVFFTSSFTEEKVSRKLLVLLSAPVSRLQVILGKMLPYLLYSVAVIVVITLALRGNVLLSLATFIPVMLFIFSIYLMVALTYRTFKDQTFFSVLALSVVTTYLVVPAMFTGVNDLSYVSPLTLAVEMYRGESFSINRYFLATTPLYLIFFLAMFMGTRIFNEEYLMGFKPLHAKVAEALYLAIDRNHLSLSVFFLSLFLVPLVFMIQLASVVFLASLPMPLTLWFLLAMSVIIEEIAKSAGIIVLLQNRAIKTRRDTISLSFLSALGFLLGEKLLLFLALSVLSESVLISAVFGTGLLVIPLALHMVSTSVVCVMTAHLGTRYYPLAILAGSAIHSIYNLYVIGRFL